MSRLGEARRQFEESWLDLRRSLMSEFGGEPRWRQEWWLPIFGFAAGLALAYVLKERDDRGGRWRIGRGRRRSKNLQAAARAAEE